MTDFTTYILFSNKLNKYYTGSTSQDISKRIYLHNINHKGFTGKADDWNLVFSMRFDSVSESRSLELCIKKRGAKRFLDNI